MRKTHLYSILAVLLLFMSICSYAEGTSTDGMNIVRTTKTQVDKPAYSTIKIAYPIIKNGTNKKALNAEINQTLEGIVNTYKKNLAENQPLTPISGLPLSADSNMLDVDYKVFHATPSLISIRFSIYTNFYGSAHPFTTFQSFNYDISQGKVLSLGDIFNSNHYLQFLATYIKEPLTKQLSTAASSPTEPFPEGLKPTSENFAIWNLTSDGLLLTFPPYQVAAYVFGPQEVTIPYIKIKSMLRLEWL